MIDYLAARERVLRSAPLLEPGFAPLASCAGRVLAVDLHAPMSLPRVRQSAMDGYALRAVDASATEPWSLPVLMTCAAGAPLVSLEPNTAARIYTGAALPLGADTVVPQELAHVQDGVLSSARPVRAGSHVRDEGSDVRAGERVLAAGTRLDAGALSLVSMLDLAGAQVTRRPHVIVLCTGDELRDAGADGGPTSVPEANARALVILAERAGAVVFVARRARDGLDELEAAIAMALERCDLLVTVGGVSVGDRDYVRSALERCGVVSAFTGVAIKPGKPLTYGTRGRARVLSLPGNPAACLLTFALFGVPLLRAMQGDARPLGRESWVRCHASIERSPDRLCVLPATFDDDSRWVRVLTQPSSGSARGLAQSDGFLLVHPGDGPLGAGKELPFVAWSAV